MPTAPIRLMCQRPGCKKYTSSPRGRFCSKAHMEADKNETRSEARAKAISDARKLLDKAGLCGCINCDGSCGKCTPAGRRLLARIKAEGKL